MIIKSIKGDKTIMESTFTAIFEKDDDWYIGYVEELPGAHFPQVNLKSESF